MADEFVSHITSVEMLDLYAAREGIGFDGPSPQLIELNRNESPVHYVQRIALRFADLVPYVTQMILEGHFFFRGYTPGLYDVREDGRLALPPDGQDLVQRSAHGIRRIYDADEDERIPDKCALVTMAAQKMSKDWEEFFTSFLKDPQIVSSFGQRLPETRSFKLPELLIDDRIFSHPTHSALSRAVLLLHEYIYLVVRTRFNENDSRNVRRLISYLIRKSPSFTDGEVGGFVLRAWLGKVLVKLPGMSPDDAIATGAEIYLSLILRMLQHDFVETRQKDPKISLNDLRQRLIRSFDNARQLYKGSYFISPSRWKVAFPDYSSEDVQIPWLPKNETDRWDYLLSGEVIQSLLDMAGDPQLDCYTIKDGATGGVCVNWVNAWTRKIAPLTIVPVVD